MLYVDRHLHRRCRLADLARVACYSPFHFTKAFQSAMGESPHAYVYRKRMEWAGFRLLDGNQRITDIALEVGYETTSAFSKGFKWFAGIAPRRFRDTVSRPWFLKTNRPFHPAKARRNGSKDRLTPLLMTLPPLAVVYRENRGIVDGSFLTTGQKSFRRLALRLVEHDLENAVQAYVGIYPYRFFNLADDNALSYTGAVVDNCRTASEKLPTLVLPGGRYAAFPHFGPYEFLMQTWNTAYLDWLPRSGAMLRDAPPFERYVVTTAPTAAIPLRAWIMIPIH